MAHFKFDENGGKVLQKGRKHCWKNGRKFGKLVANTVGKGEIVHDEQFLPLSTVFSRLVLQTDKNQCLFGKGFSRAWPVMVYIWTKSISSEYFICRPYLESAAEPQDWRQLQRHYLHPHYSSSIFDETINRPSNAIQSAINRAIAGTKINIFCHFLNGTLVFNR